MRKRLSDLMCSYISQPAAATVIYPFIQVTENVFLTFSLHHKTQKFYLLNTVNGCMRAAPRPSPLSLKQRRGIAVLSHLVRQVHRHQGTFRFCSPTKSFSLFAMNVTRNSCLLSGMVSRKRNPRGPVVPETGSRYFIHPGRRSPQNQ